MSLIADRIKELYKEVNKSKPFTRLKINRAARMDELRSLAKQIDEVIDNLKSQGFITGATEFLLKKELTEGVA